MADDEREDVVWASQFNGVKAKAVQNPLAAPKAAISIISTISITQAYPNLQLTSVHGQAETIGAENDGASEQRQAMRPSGLEPQEAIAGPRIALAQDGIPGSCAKAMPARARTTAVYCIVNMIV